MVVPYAWAEKISFRQAVQLAMKRSPEVGMALADELKAHQGYLETKTGYIPQVTVGSGIAKVWGYPVSIEGAAPAAFNVNAQSYLVNFAQNNFVAAARTDWHAATDQLEDQRQAALLETILVYVQLDQSASKLQALQRESDEARRLESISRDRFQEGIDSKLDVTKASLNAARVQLRLTDLEGDVDLLRQRLAQLTGLNAHDLETDTSSIPAQPEISPQDDLPARAVANSPSVKAAEEKARSSEQRARGEHHQLYPAVDLVSSYGLFTKYDNLNLLFPAGAFQRNNATFGIAIHLPLLNFTERSRATAADAEALKARKQADAIRALVANDTLKLQKAVLRLGAARDVAQLESDVAQADVEAVHGRIQAGTGTIKDEETARIEAAEKQAALDDSQFELERARFQLLRATGELERWALP
jgi:outer membrane protein TolC